MRKKKTRKQRNPKITAIFLCLMFVFIAELFFYTWCRVQSVRIKYEITRQTARIGQLSAMQDNLEIEIARLKSPSRIAKIAKTQLGLVTPTSKQMFSVRKFSRVPKVTGRVIWPSGVEDSPGMTP